MIIPLKVSDNKGKIMVMLGDIDTGYNITNKREVGLECFDKEVIPSIKDPLERLCAESELNELLSSDSTGRILAFRSKEKNLNSDAEFVLSTGLKGKISDIEDLAYKSGPKIAEQDMIRLLSTTATVFNDVYQIRKTEDGMWHMTYADEITSAFGGRTKCDFYVWIDLDTGYPFIVMLFNGRVYRFLMLSALNNTDWIGTDAQGSNIVKFVYGRKGSFKSVERLYSAYREQDTFVYPLIEENKLAELLGTLGNISNRLVLPFYLAYMGWHSSGAVRSIKLGDRAYWHVDEDEDEGFESAMSVFGVSVESARVIKDKVLYGLRFETGSVAKLMPSATANLDLATRQICEYVFIDLTGLRLERDSLFQQIACICYYIKDSAGASKSCLQVKVYLEDTLTLYLAPSADIDTLMQLIVNVWDKTSLVILVSRDEWYQQGLGDALKELLARLDIESMMELSRVTNVLTNDDKRSVSQFRVRFVRKPITPKGEAWIEKFGVLTDIVYSTNNIEIINAGYSIAGNSVGTPNLLNRGRVYKDLLLGVLRKVDLEQYDNAESYRVISFNKRENNREIEYLKVNEDSFVANIKGMHYEVTLDRKLSDTIPFMLRLARYIKIDADGIDSQPLKGIRELARIVYWDYKGDYESEIKKKIESLEHTGELKTIEVVPLSIKGKLDRLLRALVDSLKD